MTPIDTLDVVEHHSTPRLRLKGKAPRSGFVDGAWWPHSTDLTTELPDLVAVVSVRLGRISRVLYNLDGWSLAPKRITTDGQVLRLDGYRYQPHNTIEILGRDGGRLALLVVPPSTDAADAHTIMMAAAQRSNADSTAALLEMDGVERDDRVPA